MTFKLLNLADPNLLNLIGKSTSTPSATETENSVKQKILEEEGFISSANNKSGAEEFYEGRTNYKEIYNTYRNNIKDLWYHVPFYGKTNKRGLAAAIYHTYDNIVMLDGVEMMDFVALAFAEFMEDFNKRKDLPCCKGINKNSSFLKEIAPKRSYQNEEDARDLYLEGLYDDFYREVLINLQSSPKIKNFDDFYRYLKIYLMTTRNTLTTSGFTESYRKTDYHTGLIVDILAVQEDLDATKVKFLESPNYKTYSTLAQRYGFKVDVNIPWRLIADVNSEQMAKYIAMARGEGTTYESLIRTNAPYLNLSARYNGFLFTLIDFYEKFIAKHPKFAPLSSKGELTSLFQEKNQNPETMRKSNYDRYTTLRQRAFSTDTNIITNILNVRIVPLKIIGWYTEIRNIERKSPYNSTQLHRIKTQAGRFYSKAIESLPKDKNNSWQVGSRVEFYKFANLAIIYIESLLGTIGAHSPAIALTSREEAPIMMMNVTNAVDLGTIISKPQEEIRQSPYEWNSVVL